MCDSRQGIKHNYHLIRFKSREGAHPAGRGPRKCAVPSRLVTISGASVGRSMRKYDSAMVLIRQRPSRLS